MGNKILGIEFIDKGTCHKAFIVKFILKGLETEKTFDVIDRNESFYGFEVKSENGDFIAKANSLIGCKAEIVKYVRNI